VPSAGLLACSPSGGGLGRRTAERAAAAPSGRGAGRCTAECAGCYPPHLVASYQVPLRYFPEILPKILSRYLPKIPPKIPAIGMVEVTELHIHIKGGCEDIHRMNLL